MAAHTDACDTIIHKLSSILFVKSLDISLKWKQDITKPFTMFSIEVIDYFLSLSQMCTAANETNWLSVVLSAIM